MPLTLVWLKGSVCVKLIENSHIKKKYISTLFVTQYCFVDDFLISRRKKSNKIEASNLHQYHFNTTQK